MDHTKYIMSNNDKIFNEIENELKLEEKIKELSLSDQVLLAVEKELEQERQQKLQETEERRIQNAKEQLPFIKATRIKNCERINQ